MQAGLSANSVDRAYRRCCNSAAYSPAPACITRVKAREEPALAAAEQCEAVALGWVGCVLGQQSQKALLGHGAQVAPKQQHVPHGAVPLQKCQQPQHWPGSNAQMRGDGAAGRDANRCIGSVRDGKSHDQLLHFCGTVAAEQAERRACTGHEGCAFATTTPGWYVICVPEMSTLISSVRLTAVASVSTLQQLKDASNLVKRRTDTLSTCRAEIPAHQQLAVSFRTPRW